MQSLQSSKRQLNYFTKVLMSGLWPKTLNQFLFTQMLPYELSISSFFFFISGLTTAAGYFFIFIVLLLVDRLSNSFFLSHVAPLLSCPCKSFCKKLTALCMSIILHFLTFPEQYSSSVNLIPNVCK